MKFSRNTLLLLLLIWVVSWFGSIELRGLFIPDEGRYAEIPREMVATGDWVTPRLNDLKYFDKPPLQYWLTATSLATFGDDEWSARLPTALLGFLAVLATGFTARRLWGNDGAISTTTVLGSSWAFYLASQYLTLDMTLTAFLTTALCSFLLAQESADSAARNRRFWMCAAWASCALAVLSKGLIGLVLPTLTLMLYSVIARDWRVWKRLEIARGVLIFLLIVAPWFVLVQQRNPEFLDIFFIREHVERFTSFRHERYGPWWYYAPILLVGLMPWLPGIVYQLFRQPDTATPDVKRKKTFRPDLFCIAWVLAILVFFSLSRSKLPAYIIPVFPALALLAGRRAFLEQLGVLRSCAVACVVVGTALTFGATQLHLWEKFVAIGPDAVSGLPWVFVATASLIVGGVAALLLLWRSQLPGSAVAITVGSFAFWGFVFVFLQHVDAAFSSERLIKVLVADERPFAPEAPFYSLGSLDYSVPFYLGRPVTVVGHRGELDAGLLAEPGKGISSTAEFRQRWVSGVGRAYAVMRADRYAELMQAGLAMNLVTRDRRLVVVSRGDPSPPGELAASR